MSARDAVCTEMYRNDRRYTDGIIGYHNRRSLPNSLRSYSVGSLISVFATSSSNWYNYYKLYYIHLYIIIFFNIDGYRHIICISLPSHKFSSFNSIGLLACSIATK